MSSDGEQVIEIRVPDGAHPVYADAAKVRHDTEGFLIDFYMMEPEEPDTGWLAVRVRVGHRMAIRLAQTLVENVSKWAPKELELRQTEEETLRKFASGSGEGDKVVELLEALKKSVEDVDRRQSEHEPAREA